MSKDKFELNLDSLYIQFRVKPGEKKEIYDYALEHGFNNISTFVKTIIWKKIRGNSEEKDINEYREAFHEFQEVMKEKFEKQEILLNALIEKQKIIDLLEEEANNHE